LSGLYVSSLHQEAQYVSNCHAIGFGQAVRNLAFCKLSYTIGLIALSIFCISALQDSVSWAS